VQVTSGDLKGESRTWKIEKSRAKMILDRSQKEFVTSFGSEIPMTMARSFPGNRNTVRSNMQEIQYQLCPDVEGGSVSRHRSQCTGYRELVTEAMEKIFQI
jgi:hypothetical protein